MPEPRLSRLAGLGLLVRLCGGDPWIQAGLGKLGSGLGGLLAGALTKAGAQPDVQGWSAAFRQDFVLQRTVGVSSTVACGETAVGVALILGVIPAIAAVFGCCMNLHYLLAGTVAVNPVPFVLGLVLAWRVAGCCGADRWMLPALGTPGSPARPATSARTPEVRSAAH